MSNSSAPFLSINLKPATGVALTVDVITFVTALIGNAFVLAVVRRKVNRSTNDLFIVNLSISDLVYLAVSMPGNFHDMFSVPRSHLYCTVIRPLVTMAFCLSIFTITSMAVHRCHVMLHPYKPKIRRNMVYFWIFCVWLLSFLVSLPAFIVSKTTPQGTCTGDWALAEYKSAYIIALLLLKSVFPLTIIAVAYFQIGIYLARNKVPRTSLDEKKQSNRRHCSRKENLQVVKMSIVIVLLFGLCTAPHQIAWMLSQFGDSKQLQISNVIFMFSGMLQDIHACVNPFIYGIMSQQFRRDYIRIFASLLICSALVRCREKLLAHKHAVEELGSRRCEERSSKGRNVFTNQMSMEEGASNIRGISEERSSKHSQ